MIDPNPDALSVTAAMLDAVFVAALSGDARHAKAELLSLAKSIAASPQDFVNLDERRRNFLAEALRRVAESPAAIAAVCQASLHKGRKEKTGRPMEHRKGLNVALYMAGHLRRSGGTVEEAIAAVRVLPWAPRDRRTILRHWKANKAQAVAVDAECGPD